MRILNENTRLGKVDTRSVRTPLQNGPRKRTDVTTNVSNISPKICFLKKNK